MVRPYLWIVIVGAITSFFDACGIGSNDLANSFGTIYGSKVMSLKQIVLLASVCEFSGALLLGSQVTSTLAGSIADVRVFRRVPYVLMYGMLSALAASTLWIYTATYLELPVSTTHSIVGGILGFSMAYGGPRAILWYMPTNEFPYMKGVVPIVVSWFTSPVLSGLCSMFIYGVTRTWILRSKNSAMRSIYYLPWVVLFTFYIEAFFILTKGAKSRIKWSMSQSAWVSACIASGASLMSFGFVPYLRKKVRDDIDGNAVVAPNEMGKMELALASADTGEEGYRVVLEIGAGNKDGEGHGGAGGHRDVRVEQYDPHAETCFKYLQIFTSICASFAHGANDVSNSIGPFAAIYHIYQKGNVTSRISVPIWILCIGGSGIVVGLATYGANIMRVLGEKITPITPSRGFSAELATALVVSFASAYGIPISSTQCITGAVIGISLMDMDIRSLRWKMIGKMYAAWVFTLAVTGVISAGIFSQGVHSPNIA